MKTNNSPILISPYENNKNIYYYPESGDVVLDNDTPSAIKCDNSQVCQIENVVTQFNRLTLRVTGNCNMSCDYCFTQFHPCLNVIKKSFYRNAIEDFINSFTENKTVSFILTGGEPLLYKDVVYDIITFAYEKAVNRNLNCNFLIYTNCTLIDTYYINIFQKYNVSLAVSLDGVRSAHNLRRPMKNKKDSYKLILKNLLLLHENNIHVEVRTVIQPDETNIIPLIENNIHLGFSGMHLLPVYGYNKKQITNSKIWIDALHYYVSLLKKHYMIEIVPFFQLFRKMAYPSYFITSFYPCDSGKNSICMSDTGEYYICSHFIGKPELSLGRYSDNIPMPETINAQIKSCLNPTCQICWARRLCGGSCYHRTVLGMAPTGEENCLEWLTVIREAIICYVDLIKSAPDVRDFLCHYNPILPTEVQKNIHSEIEKQLRL